METISQIVARALHSDVDLTEHLQVVDWCMRHVDRFSQLDTRERHNKASHVQMEAAVLAGAICPRESSLDETPFISPETAMSFAFAAMENEILSMCLNQGASTLNAASLRLWAQKTVPGVANLNFRACERLVKSVLARLRQSNVEDVGSETERDDLEDTIVKQYEGCGNVTVGATANHDSITLDGEAEDSTFRPGLMISRPFQEKKMSRKEKKKTKKIYRGNEIEESVQDIASRFPLKTLAFIRPHTVWAWCVLNVDGFAASANKFRIKVSNEVIEYLESSLSIQGKGDGKDHDSRRAHAAHINGETTESAKDLKRKKMKEMWYRQVHEPAESIAKRFPRDKLNYSEEVFITAWCILKVKGFAESGQIWRRKIPQDIRDILEAKYGPYEVHQDQE